MFLFGINKYSCHWDKVRKPGSDGLPRSPFLARAGACQSRGGVPDHWALVSRDRLLSFLCCWDPVASR